MPPHRPALPPSRLSALDSTVDSLTYDGWERLLTWRESRKTPPGSTWSLIGDSVSFDGAGNVLTVGGAETYGTKKGRLISRTDPVTGNWTYSYDAAGNQTQATVTLAGSTKTWSYAYDALNRLVAVRYTPPGGSPGLVARYGYDVLGRRIVKRVYSKPQGGTIAYIRMSYAGDAVAFETDSAGVNIKMQYTWGADVDDLLGVRDSVGTDFQVVQDQLHSVRGLVRRDGTWVMDQRFLPSGQLLSQDASGSAALPQPTLRYGWTGREYDAETGLYFNRARYYDPGQRRFTQEDPIGYGGGANLYAYTGGRVLDGRDPSGMHSDEPYTIITAIGLCTSINGALDDCGGGGGGGTWGERRSREAQYNAAISLAAVERHSQEKYEAAQAKDRARQNNSTSPEPPKGAVFGTRQDFTEKGSSPRGELVTDHISFELPDGSLDPSRGYNELMALVVNRSEVITDIRSDGEFWYTGTLHSIDSQWIVAVVGFIDPEDGRGYWTVTGSRTNLYENP